MTRSRGRAERIHNPDAERNPATAHLFIINPLSGERMDNLFSTHPNTENRIAALEAMAAAAPNAGQPQAAAPRQTQRPRPEAPKANPWGRNPTGPRSGGFKGPWS